MSACCNTVPVITVTNIAVNTTTNIATLTFSGSLPSSGCFNIRIPGGCRCLRINPCSTARVQLTNGTTTYTNVLGRCGNYLLLGQIARHVMCGRCLHMNMATAPANQMICLDRLCPPANGTPVAVPVSVSVTPAVSSTESPDEANVVKAASSK